jgi:hypothetical protein
LAKVTVKNVSGKQVVLAERGSEALTFSLEVKNSRGWLMDRTEAVMIEKPIVLKNQEQTEFLIYVNSAYTISKIDAYNVRARVAAGDYAHFSEKKYFDTYDGIIDSKMTTSEPDRTYTLRRITRANKGQFLYLRIDDSQGKMNYGVQILDTMVPVFKPRMVMDGKGRVHTLHRKSPQQYCEVIMDADARLLERHYYRASFGEINFMRDEAGNIRVSGVSEITQ